MNKSDYYYLVSCRFCTDPEIYDLEWLWMAWMVIMCYSNLLAICIWV